MRLRHLFSETDCCMVDSDHPLRSPVTLVQLFEVQNNLAQFTGVTMQTRELKARSGRNGSHSTITVPSFYVIPGLICGTRSVRYPTQPDAAGGMHAFPFAGAPRDVRKAFFERAADLALEVCLRILLASQSSRSAPRRTR